MSTASRKDACPNAVILLGEVVVSDISSENANILVCTLITLARAIDTSARQVIASAGSADAARAIGDAGARFVLANHLNAAATEIAIFFTPSCDSELQ